MTTRHRGGCMARRRCRPRSAMLAAVPHSCCTKLVFVLHLCPIFCMVMTPNKRIPNESCWNEIGSVIVFGNQDDLDIVFEPTFLCFLISCLQSLSADVCLQVSLPPFSHLPFSFPLSFHGFFVFVFSSGPKHRHFMALRSFLFCCTACTSKRSNCG